MNSIDVERTIWIDAPRDRVWAAVTTAKLIEQWWGDTWSIEPLAVGGKVKFGNESDGYAYATVTVFDPPSAYAMQWEPMDAFPAALSTTFKLVAENSGTRLTVTESGFEKLPDDIRQKRMESTGEGYTTVLTDLKKLIEQGNP